MGIDYTKPPLTFEQQLDLLVQRGLRITDRTQAVQTLSSISYYRLSAYCLPFKTDHDHFLPNSTWEEVVQLYEFDRLLRLCIMDALERFEVALRTSVTYRLSHVYGPFAHINSNNFRDGFKHIDWLDKVDAEARKSRETFIEHYRLKYNGFPHLPIWMASEVMTFGTLSRLYEGMQETDQRAIAKACKLPHFVLRSWLRTLTYIRNTCAHHARLWNRELANSPLLPRAKHGWPSNIIPNQKRLFCVLVILRHLLHTQGMGDVWQEEVADLIRPVAVNPHFRAVMGLPKNWEDHPKWKMKSSV